MGLFGGGNSKRTTSNNDNRTINDNSGQEIDNSIYQDTDNSVYQEIYEDTDNSVYQEIYEETDNSVYQDIYEETDNSIYQDIDNSNYQRFDDSLTGDYNNNTGSIAITDGGAFALADSVAQSNAYLTDTAMNLAGSVSNFALQTGFELGDRGLAVGESVAAMGLNTAQNLALGYGDLVNEQGNRNLNAALMVNQSGIEQLQIGSDLVMAISAQGSAQQADNNASLNNGFKGAMQFVESFSRSDGASIAETTNKTMMFLVGAAVVGVFIMKKVK